MAGLHAIALRHFSNPLAVIAARQDDTSGALETCIYNCLVGAVDTGSCGLDLKCMCGDSGFRNRTLQCMNSSCSNVGGAVQSQFATALDSVLQQCRAGAFDLPGSSDGPSGYSGIPLPSYTPPPSTPSKSTNNPTKTPAGQTGGNKDDSKPNTGLIVGATVGGLVVLAIIGVFIWWLVRRNRRNNATALGSYNQPVVENKPGVLGQHQSYNGGNVGGFQQPPSNPSSGYGQSNTTSMYGNLPPSQQYAPSTAAATYGQPNPNLGYVPPSHFETYGAGIPAVAAAGAGAAGAAALAPHHQQQHQQPSQSGSMYASSATSSSGAPLVSPGGTSSDGQGYNPYGAWQQPGPLQLHQAPQQPAQQPQSWPADVKKPMNVMSAETQAPQEEAPPPVYHQ